MMGIGFEELKILVGQLSHFRRKMLIELPKIR